MIVYFLALYVNGLSDKVMSSNENQKLPLTIAQMISCPHTNYQGYCRLLTHQLPCSFLHDDICDHCHMPQLHPTNQQQRDRHRLVRHLSIIE
jgi:hypothetical protein